MLHSPTQKTSSKHITVLHSCARFGLVLLTTALNLHNSRGEATRPVQPNGRIIFPAATTMITDHTDTSIVNPLRLKYPHQPTFLQAVEEMVLSLGDIFDGPDGEFYQRAFSAMTEPERIISFRVPWMDDEGRLQFNRGWRIEFSRYIRPGEGRACALLIQ